VLWAAGGPMQELGAYGLLGSNCQVVRSRLLGSGFFTQRLSEEVDPIDRVKAQL
jgi:hypothetical protein